MYKGQPLFYEIDCFLRSKGFYLFDLKKFFWRRKLGLGFDKNNKGQVIHGDALYLRKPDCYLDILSKIDKDDSSERLLKAICISWFFGYSDYALLLTEMGLSNHIISNKESISISKIIKQKSKLDLSLPYFKGKGFFRSFFGSLFDSNYNGWAKTENQELGN